MPILTFLLGGGESLVKLAVGSGRKRMLPEEVPERLGHVEIGVGHGPAMFAVADGIENHVSAHRASSQSEPKLPWPR